MKVSNGIVGDQVGETQVGGMWRGFFWAAAVFNFLVGLSGMLAPVPTIDSRIIGLLVFAFGVVYMLVARDPLRFAPVLWAGVIGKVGVVALLARDTLGEDGSALMAGVLAVDALFAVGFLAFLFTAGDDS